MDAVEEDQMQPTVLGLHHVLKESNVLLQALG